MKIICMMLALLSASAQAALPVSTLPVRLDAGQTQAWIDSVLDGQASVTVSGQDSEGQICEILVRASDSADTLAVAYDAQAKVTLVAERPDRFDSARITHAAERPDRFGNDGQLTPVAERPDRYGLGGCAF